MRIFVKTNAFSFFLMGVLQLLSMSLAWAWPPTYGLEFNISSDELRQVWNARRLDPNRSLNWQSPTVGDEWRIAHQWVEHLKSVCVLECEIASRPYGKFGLEEWIFSFSNGFKFEVTSDPGVIEVKVGPYTLEEWKRYQPQLQRYLYDEVKNSHLYYSKFKNTHLNIGVLSAFESGNHFFKYIMDYWQYPELGQGLLGKSLDNAPSIYTLSEQSIVHAQKVTTDVLSGVLGQDSDKALSIKAIASQILSSVYTSFSSTREEGSGFNNPRRYQAIGLRYVNNLGSTSLPSDAPMELRANRNPQTVAQAILQLELQEHRIEYLKTMGDYLTVLPKRVTIFSQPQDQVAIYYIYLADMGLEKEYARWKVLIADELQGIQPPAFLTKNIDQYTAVDFNQLKRFVTRARHSPYLFKKITTILSHPQLQKKSVSMELLKSFIQMQSWSLREDEPYKMRILEILKQPYWSQVADIQQEQHQVMTALQEENRKNRPTLKKAVKSIIQDCREYVHLVYRVMTY